MNFFLYLMWTITITPHTDTMSSIRVPIDLRATQSFFIHHLLIYWTYLVWLIGIWYIFSHANWEVTFGNTKVLRDDFIMIRDKELLIDCILLNLKDFNIKLMINLEIYILVTFQILSYLEFCFEGSFIDIPIQLIPIMKAQSLLKKRCQG